MKSKAPPVVPFTPSAQTRDDPRCKAVADKLAAAKAKMVARGDRLLLKDHKPFYNPVIIETHVELPRPVFNVHYVHKHKMGER